MSNDSDPNETLYEVKSIIRHRTTDRGLSYFISWKGYDESENCWVEAKDMDSPDMLEAYWEEDKKKKSRKSLETVTRPTAVSRTRMRTSLSATRTRKIIPPSSSSSSESSRETTPVVVAPTTPKKRDKIVAQVKPKENVKPKEKRILIPPPLPVRSVQKKTEPIKRPEPEVTPKSTKGKEQRTPSKPARRSHTRSPSPVISTSRHRRKSISTRVRKGKETESGSSSARERSKSSTPFDLDGMMEKAAIDEVFNDKCGFERKLEVHRIIQIGMKKQKKYALVQYKGHDVLQWVALSVVEKNDANALSMFYNEKAMKE